MREFSVPLPRTSYREGLLTALMGLGILSAVVSGQTSADYVRCPGAIPNPVILKGKRFFDTLSGSYFPVKGIAYYPRPNDGDLAASNSVDFFTDEFEDLWTQDIAHMQVLGVNTVRIYAVDPGQNHDAFMCALQKAGIYVIVGLLADCEDCGIGPGEAPSCYPPSLKERGQYIMNEFSKYANTLAFSAGNEVTLYANNRQIELNAACQKKFLRDMRSYVDTCGDVPNTILPRKVPIGMANWDFERKLQTLYFNCRTDPTDEMENAEWYGLNAYQHCNPSATTSADLDGWIGLRNDFEQYNLNVPVIISEYGCRERFPASGEFEAQRNWLQVPALYSRSYQNVFAGGIVFEFSAEKQVIERDSEQEVIFPYQDFVKLQYGVGYYSPSDCDHATTTCLYQRYPEFETLAQELQSVDVSFIGDEASYIPIYGQIPSCPEGLEPLSAFVWSMVDDEPDLPCYVVPTPFPTASPTDVAAGNGNGGNSSTSSPRHSLNAVTILLSAFLSGWTALGLS